MRQKKKLANRRLQHAHSALICILYLLLFFGEFFPPKLGGRGSHSCEGPCGLLGIYRMGGGLLRNGKNRTRFGDEIMVKGIRDKMFLGKRLWQRTGLLAPCRMFITGISRGPGC